MPKSTLNNHRFKILPFALGDSLSILFFSESWFTHLKMAMKKKFNMITSNIKCETSVKHEYDDLNDAYLAF